MDIKKIIKMKQIANSLYNISEDGTVVDHNNDQVKYGIKNGYLIFKMMQIDGKIVNQKVHRVLAETYIENLNHYKYVIHKNGKKTDNTLLNISWSKTAYKEGQIFNKNHSKTKMFGKFDADIILPNLKIAILWNGPWHYIQIKRKGHNLGQVKNRDLLKIKNFVTNGYSVYIIKDMGKYSLEKVNLEFNHFLHRLSFINLPQEYYSHLD